MTKPHEPNHLQQSPETVQGVIAELLDACVDKTEPMRLCLICDHEWHRDEPADAPTHGEDCPVNRLAALAERETPRFNFEAHLQHQREWSAATFGPGARTGGVVDHIRKELREIEADPSDIREWIDVVILALDGAWRAGYTPEAIIAALIAKQAKNEARVWPDWRTLPSNVAIEHVKAERETLKEREAREYLTRSQRHTEQGDRGN